MGRRRRILVSLASNTRYTVRGESRLLGIFHVVYRFPVHLVLYVSRKFGLLFGSVAEPKLFIFSSGSSSSSCHIYWNLKTVLQYNSSTIRNMSQYRFFFILASSKLTAVNIYKKDNFGTNSGSMSQIISAPPALAPAPQHIGQCTVSVYGIIHSVLIILYVQYSYILFCV